MVASWAWSTRHRSGPSAACPWWRVGRIHSVVVGWWDPTGLPHRCRAERSWRRPLSTRVGSAWFWRRRPPWSPSMQSSPVKSRASPVSRRRSWMACLSRQQFRTSASRSGRRGPSVGTDRTSSGIHLAAARDALVNRTVEAFTEIQPDYFVPMHCTGFFPAAMIERVLPGRVVEPSSGTRIVFGTQATTSDSEGIDSALTGPRSPSPGGSPPLPVSGRGGCAGGSISLVSGWAPTRRGSARRGL
jgi:hypothetical protein